MYAAGRSTRLALHEQSVGISIVSSTSSSRLRHASGRTSRYRRSKVSGIASRLTFVIPDFGTIEGLFQITSFELTGRHDAEVAFEIALDSAGLLTFTAP